MIAALIITLFAWPSAKIAPRDLPAGVVGAQPFSAPGFEVHRYGSEAEARDAIEEREIYGALTGGKVLVASAASAPVAHLLTHAAQGAPVEDVVPATPAANALGASVLPLVLGGILAGVLSALLRSTGFFDGAAAGGHVAVLAAWALLGLSLLAVAALRRPALAGAGGRLNAETRI